MHLAAFHTEGRNRSENARGTAEVLIIGGIQMEEIASSTYCEGENAPAERLATGHGGKRHAPQAIARD
jgi:hypothetical protein